jgi:RNA polymerase sigma factor for flagellar operon FliA
MTEVSTPDREIPAVNNAEQTNMTRLVRSLAGRVLAGLPRGSGIEMADLIQAGNVGLIQAERNYSPACGAPLSGYARFRIRGEMLDTVRRNARRCPMGLRTPMGGGEDEPDLEDIIPASESYSPLGLLTSSQTAAILDQEVDRLPARYQTVVKLRYSSDYSLREIGAVLQVNESRACQLHRSAMGRLKRALSSRGVHGLSQLM